VETLKKIFRHNWNYKLISFILALCFWMWITSQSAPITLWGEQKITVPLVLRNQPANLVVISPLNPVSVRLSNLNSDVVMDVGDVYAYIDLEDAAAGEVSRPVRIYAPEGVRVSDLSPQNLVIALDVVQDKVVPVEVDITGAPAKYYTAGDPILTPDVVSVRGPQSLLENLTSVTVAANLNGAEETLQLNRPVRFDGLPLLPDTSLRAYPNIVSVLLPIYREEESVNTVPVELELTGAPQAGKVVRAVSAVPSSLQIIGMPEVLAQIDAIRLQNLNIAGWDSTGTIEVPSTGLNLPPETRTATETGIRVLVTIGDAAVRKTLTAQVSVRNVPAGFTALPIGEIEVEVSGYPEWVTDLTPQDLVFWVDASLYAPGSHFVTPSRNLPPGVELARMPSVNLVLQPIVPEEANPETPVDPAETEAEAAAGESENGEGEGEGEGGEGDETGDGENEPGENEPGENEPGENI
jgi:YbbR domain-containing protein